MAAKRLIGMMCAACGVSAAAAALATGAGREVWLGMAAPLAVACGSWLLIVRTYRAHPEQLTGVMMGGFFVKLVFFGAYLWMAVALLHVRPAAFAASFGLYFIALHLTEAVCLRRLFAERMRTA